MGAVKNLSLKLAKLAQSVKRCFTVIAWLWHNSHSDTGISSIKWKTGSESVDNNFILTTTFVFSIAWYLVWFLWVCHLLIPLYVSFLMYGFINIWIQVLVGECFHLFLPSWCFFVFFLYAISFPGLPACPGIQQSSNVLPIFSRFAMVCFSFRTFGLVWICFWSACRQLLGSVNIENFFLLLHILYAGQCVSI